MDSVEELEQNKILIVTGSRLVRVLKGQYSRAGDNKIFCSFRLGEK